MNKRRAALLLWAAAAGAASATEAPSITAVSAIEARSIAAAAPATEAQPLVAASAIETPLRAAASAIEAQPITAAPAIKALSTTAAVPATEAQWIAAATEAVAYGRAQGMPIDLDIVSGNGLPGHTPVGLASENGRCTLIVSARNNPTADKLSAMIAPDLLEAFLAGAAMHELGHCHRRLNGYPHNEKLLPIVAWIAPVRDWFTRRVRTEEAFADMTSVAWIARYHPARYAALVNEMLRVRTRFREPKHDTVAMLESALAEGPQDANENLFLQADQRLNRYR